MLRWIIIVSAIAVQAYALKDKQSVQPTPYNSHANREPASHAVNPVVDKSANPTAEQKDPRGVRLDGFRN